MIENMRKRLGELRVKRAEIERRHTELQQMLNQTANDFIRTGGALEELELQLELVGSEQNPPEQAEGGGN